MRTLGVWLLMTAAVLAADSPADWKYVQEVQVQQAGLIKLRLPADTLDTAGVHLKELRILDPTGHEVPYLVEAAPPNLDFARRGNDFRVTTGEQSTVISIITDLKQPINAVTFETPVAGFAKGVTVEGTNPGQTWQPLVSNQQIFRQPNGVGQLRVTLPPGTWSALRAVVDDHRSAPVPFTGAILHTVDPHPAPLETVPVAVLETAEGDRQTRLKLDLGSAHQTLAALRFEIADPVFMRPVTLAVQQFTKDTITELALVRSSIFRTAPEAGLASVEQVAIPLNLEVPRWELLVLIGNGNDSPLRIASVSATFRPIYVGFFASESGRYQLLTGNPRAPVPQYDLAALAGSLRNVVVTLATVSARQVNSLWTPSEPAPRAANADLPLDTAAWSDRRACSMTRAGFQELDLDPAVVAQAGSALQDFRLLRNQRPQPFLLEQTSLMRGLVPQVTMPSDPNRPARNRWVLQLPYRQLPLTRITCTTQTPTFRRAIKLSEQPTDNHGKKYDRTLGTATWIQNSPTSNPILEVTLASRPLTDTLILETDDRDPAALELSRFQCWYPVTRLLFDAPLDPTTYLYYGNPTARPLTYDLGPLIQLWQEQTPAHALLGTAEEVGTMHSERLLRVMRSKHLRFYAALEFLALIVGGVIARRRKSSVTGS